MQSTGKKLVRTIVFSFFYIALLHTSANAIFSRDYQKKLGLGAYKRIYNSDIYMLAEVGFAMKTWAPNMLTSLSASDNITKYLIQVPDEITKDLRARMGYSIRVGFGYHTEESRIRHEISFRWHSFMTKTINLTGATIDINGITYNYALFGDKLPVTAGAYGNIYKIMYNFNYDFKNVFKIFKMNWDLYASVGIGLAVINSGAYAGSEIIQTSRNNEGEILYISSYSDNKIKSVANADKHKIERYKSFGIGYNVAVGTIINLGQSFAANLGLEFDATTRPLITTSFKKIHASQDVSSHLEYSILFKLGILIKAFELRRE